MVFGEEFVEMKRKVAAAFAASDVVDVNFSRVKPIVATSQNFKFPRDIGSQLSHQFSSTSVWITREFDLASESWIAQLTFQTPTRRWISPISASN